jgi:fibronectin type 3 domain-containing protein
MTRPFRKTRMNKRNSHRPEIEMLEGRVLLSSSPLPPMAYTDPVIGQPDANDNVVLGNPTGGGGSSSGGPTFGPGAVPQLSSLPGAKCSIYLNFTGDFTAHWGGYSNINTPAYDIDGDPTTFTQTELNNITKIWQFVAEDYAPFNINVTTVQPANLGYGYTQKVDIGGNGAWTGGNYGGISYIGSFTGSGPNISFVFPNNLGNGTPKYVGDASSHEAGHSFGLVHQSLYDANGNKIAEYYTGPGNGTAPIMGDSYNAPLSRWWYGTDANGPNQYQDDMAIIANAKNGFGYRDDSTGNSIASANQLTLSAGQVSGSGILISTSDTDFWSFSTLAGQITLNVNVASGVNNLVAKLVLEDANGNVVATVDANNGYNASLTTTVGAGTYYVVAESHGGYGDVGQYSISGTIIPPNTTPPATPTGLTATAGDAQVTLKWNASSGATSYNIYRSLTPGGEGTTAYKTGVTTISFTDTGLTNGTTYYYEVSAVNSAGESGQSSEASATPQLVKPATPTGLAAKAGDSQVILNWNASTGATSYNIYRSLTPGGEGTVAYKAGVTTNSFTDTGLTNGTTYYYTVTAVNAAGESGPSSEASATPQKVTFSLAIDSGGGAAGNFVSDTDVKGGHQFSTKHAIDTSQVTNPAPQSVYQTERYGNFTYTIPNLTPGATYTVRLHFAEIYWGAAGRRLFDVKINGSQVLTNFDIFATAGGKYKAIVEQFTATADANGNLTIQYITLRDNAKSSGIEILSQSGAPRPAANHGGTAQARVAQFGNDLGRIAQFFSNTSSYSGWTTWATQLSHNTQGLQSYLTQWANTTMTQQTLETLLGSSATRHATHASTDWTDDLLVQLQL